MRKKHPNKLKCIREFCFGCSGESTKEVTLCVVVKCPLWEYRTGNHVSSKAFQYRLATAHQNYPEEVADILKDPEMTPFFKLPSSKVA